MNVKKCANGHFFDADKYQLCPHCGVSAEDSQSKSHKNESKQSYQRKKRDDKADVVVRSMPQKTIGKTMGLFDEVTQDVPSGRVIRKNSEFSSAPKKEPMKATQKCFSCGREISATAHFCKYCGTPMKQQAASAINASADVNMTEQPSTDPVKEDTLHTEENYVFHMNSPVQPVAEKPEQHPSVEQEEDTPTLKEAIRNAVSGNDGRTIGFFSMGSTEEIQNDSEPVVGWLVCVKGKHFGESFQIYAGRNAVGRGVANKIILSKDNSVSREKHAWITYEPKHREFFLQPGESSGLSYLNGENIMTATKLKAKDTLEFGDGMYLLIPLCGDDFSWEEYIK